MSTRQSFSKKNGGGLLIPILSKSSDISKISDFKKDREFSKFLQN
jgi:hypothetical protein